MNPFWKQVIINTILKKEHVKPGEEPDYTTFQLAKGFFRFMQVTRRIAKDIVLMGMGIMSAAFGLESFLIPNDLIDGGATGISLLSSEVSGVPLYYFILLINIPFIFLALKVVGRDFAIKTTIAIIGLSLSVAFIHFPDVTHDELLAAVFGGFFLGAGIGLSVRGGAVIDGTEVLAIFLSRKLSTTLGDIIIVINVIIFTVAAYLLSIDTALYSMITYLAASRTLDFVVEGIEEYTGVTIISPHHDEIRQMIVNEMGRGVTVYRGRRGHGKSGETKDVDILYTVITRLELSKLKAEIETIDPNAFVVMSSVNDTKGGMIKKRPLKH